MMLYGHGHRLVLAGSAPILDDSWGSRFVIPPHLGTWTALVGLGALETSAVGCGVEGLRKKGARRRAARHGGPELRPCKIK